MSVSCELEGIPQLLQRFEQLAMNSNAAQRSGLELAGEKLVSEVKQTNKFEDKSGNLRRSITKSDVKNSKYGKYVWVGDVEGKTNYSWFVEFGRSGGANGYVAPTYFLKGTMLDNQDKLKNIMLNELIRGLGI